MPPQIIHHCPDLDATPLVTSCGVEVAAGILVTLAWDDCTCPACQERRDD